MVETDLCTLTCIWRGDRRWDDALRSTQLKVDGPAAIRRGLPRWLRLSALAPVPRPVTEALPPADAEAARWVIEPLRR